jgi:excisionase family DNA binding protein
MLTIYQAAQRLGIQPATVRAWIFRREHLDFVKVGRSVRIPEEAVERFIRVNTVQISAKFTLTNDRQEHPDAETSARRFR